MGVYVTAHELKGGVYGFAPYPQFGDIQVVSIFNDGDDKPVPSFKLTHSHKTLFEKFTNFNPETFGSEPHILESAEVAKIAAQLELVDPANVQAAFGITSEAFKDITDFLKICAKQNYSVSFA